MKAEVFSFEVKTTDGTDILEITPEVESAIHKFNTENGLVTVFIPGSTAAVSTIEYEEGVVEDLRRAIEELVPQNRAYLHDKRWGDGNGYSHVRAALLKPSLSIPLVDGDLMLGTWQQIVLMDFDNRPRNRRVIVQVLG